MPHQHTRQGLESYKPSHEASEGSPERTAIDPTWGNRTWGAGPGWCACHHGIGTASAHTGPMPFWGMPMCQVPLPPEIAKKMEMATLEANVVQLEQQLKVVRARIRDLLGYDPGSEAGLP